MLLRGQRCIKRWRRNFDLDKTECFFEDNVVLSNAGAGNWNFDLDNNECFFEDSRCFKRWSGISKLVRQKASSRTVVVSNADPESNIEYNWMHLRGQRCFKRWTGIEYRIQLNASSRTTLFQTLNRNLISNTTKCIFEDSVVSNAEPESNTTECIFEDSVVSNAEPESNIEYNWMHLRGQRCFKRWTGI